MSDRHDRPDTLNKPANSRTHTQEVTSSTEDALRPDFEQSPHCREGHRGPPIAYRPHDRQKTPLLPPGRDRIPFAPSTYIPVPEPRSNRPRGKSGQNVMHSGKEDFPRGRGRTIQMARRGNAAAIPVRINRTVPWKPGILLAFLAYADMSFSIATNQIDPEIGKAYQTVPVAGTGRFYVRPTERAATPDASRLMLFESGRALGPRHSVRADIRTQAGGRFRNGTGHSSFRPATDPIHAPTVEPTRSRLPSSAILASSLHS
ncbi:hypothetical protein ABIB85_006269 [Bradyrhizobium sp. JR1.5]